METANETFLDQTVQLKGIIKEHALEDMPYECCGFVIQNRHGNLEVFKCKNEAEDKKNYYKISSEEYLIASSIGDILATYHSHPQGKAEFSSSDKKVSEGHKIDLILYSVETDEFKEYTPLCNRK